MDKMIYFAIFIIVVSTFFIGRGCQDLPVNPTVTEYKVIPYPTYRIDTIKVKQVEIKYQDKIYFDSVHIPCGDTAFIVHSDTIFVPSGDTINMSFNYKNNLGNFGLLYKPKPDSIIVKTIQVPEQNNSNYGYFVGSFGIGAILGIIAGMANK
jgi:hypothetical protein